MLVSSVPGLGHLVPMLDLAVALQGAGHEVRVATNQEFHRVIVGAGLDAMSAGMSNVEMRELRSRRWPETDAQPVSLWATRMWAQVMAPSALADLLVRLREWPPDVVLHDEGEYAAPVAAANAGIPWVTHGWGSPLRSARELAEIEDLASALWESCGCEVPAAAGLYAHALVNPCPPMLQAQPPGASVVWAIRPRVLEGRGPALAADVYIGFGTVARHANAPAQLAAAVRACTSRGLRTVLTAPSEQLRRELVAIDERLVQAFEFVSLPALLGSCKLVISHAGAGTVLASLTAGVPLLLMPRGTPSQLRMADACDRAGVGRRCEPDDLDAALEEVMDDPAIAAAASQAARQIAEMPPASSVVPLIASLTTAAPPRTPRQ